MSVILPGYSDTDPTVTVGTAVRPVSPIEHVRVVTIKVGDEKGYKATMQSPERAMGTCAAIIDQCRDLGVDVMADLLAWCLAIATAPGVDIETATRRVEGRLLDAAVELARQAGGTVGESSP